MFENNGFAFDTAGSFFGESTTPSYGNGFSNAGPSDGFFGENAFDENGFSTSETSAFGESTSYGGGFTQFGSAFSESALGEDGFSADGMFCEGDNSTDSDKKGDYIDKHKGENSVGSKDFYDAWTKRAIRKKNNPFSDKTSAKADEAEAEGIRHFKKQFSVKDREIRKGNDDNKE